ncbi:MAG TPA: protoheme IX farnesyltransferase [Anaerolineales bacterium]|nr:protoheme IX farnesyltransferase [Anaerolineales bacterium]
MFKTTHMTGLTLHLKEDILPLLKLRQTLLLTLTGVAGYLTRQTFPIDGWQFMGLIMTLLLTISGCTILNMRADRDIDKKMKRTSTRPLAIGRIDPRSALTTGIVLIIAGLAWSFVLSRLYFSLALTGIFLDLIIYTYWLKRQTAWSVLWGGFSGGIPILAGSVLATGRIDMIGIILCLAIVTWIPSHNLTLGILNASDYLNAGVPTFINSYGLKFTQVVIMGSTLVEVVLLALGFAWLGFPSIILGFLVLCGIAIFSVALLAWKNPSSPMILKNYKYSSIYMLAVMILLMTSLIV